MIPFKSRQLKTNSKLQTCAKNYNNNITQNYNKPKQKKKLLTTNKIYLNNFVFLIAIDIRLTKFKYFSKQNFLRAEKK